MEKLINSKLSICRLLTSNLFDTSKSYQTKAQIESIEWCICNMDSIFQNQNQHIV